MEDIHSRYLRGIAFYDGHKLDTSDLDLPVYIGEKVAEYLQLHPPSGGGVESVTSYDNNADALAALGAGKLYKSTTLINGSPIILLTV